MLCDFLITAAALVQSQQPISIFNETVIESEDEESVTGCNDVTDCDDEESDSVRRDNCVSFFPFMSNSPIYVTSAELLNIF